MKTLIIAATALLLAAPALAQPAGPGEPPPQGQALREADTNKDGGIDAAEFAAMRTKQFSRLDAAGAGKITKADFPAALERVRQEQIRQRGEKMFDRLDANKDGAVSQQEFLARNDEAFKRMDRNGDGKLTRADRGRGRGNPGQDGPDGDDAMDPPEKPGKAK